MTSDVLYKIALSLEVSLADIFDALVVIDSSKFIIHVVSLLG